MSSSSTPAKPTDLKVWLAALFQKNGGAIPFERFMAEALYHPGFGYYPRHIRTVGGSRGDFATSPTLNSLLGKAIARWIVAEAETLELSRPIHVIEVGGGEGSLMRDIIEVLETRSWWSKLIAPRFRYHLVEISPRLRQGQRETLHRYRRQVTWHERIESALATTEGTALIFSNELVDAFPVIALRRETDRWSEVFVNFDPEKGVSESFRPLSESRPDLESSAFAALEKSAAWPVGQRVELHTSFRGWQQKWADQWKRGAMLTIDYGSRSVEEIYQRRTEGSLRAFYRHQRLTGAGLYRMFGKQDLTADVCFADLIRWGEASGWETVGLQTQADFLREFAGAACGEAARTDRSAAFLFEPGGAGEAFQVLSQRKR